MAPLTLELLKRPYLDDRRRTGRRYQKASSTSSWSNNNSDWLSVLAPVAYFPSGSVGSSGREGLEGMLVFRARPGCNNNTSSAVSRRRQSDLPGTPRRIRATSAGTARWGAAWGDKSHVPLTLLEHGSREPWEKCWRLLQAGGKSHHTLDIFKNYFSTMAVR